jgi:hypothetical protein
MNSKTVKHELQHILRGKGEVSFGTPIQTISSYLRKSARTSEETQKNEQNKTEETKILIQFINQNNLWNCNVNFDLFLSEGAEQKVYIENEKTVLKLNDTIYYNSWLDYFDNLLLNNYFFPDTAYQLKGFYKSEDNIIYALVEQNYIESNQPTDLEKVRLFLSKNGFQNIRNNDYLHPILGIILEDLHDENVLTNNEILFFIDTVFYIKPEIFWN